MTTEQINTLQEQYGYLETQNLINTGDIWKFEGSAGREAMSLLKTGICYLPKKETFDYYGNRIPSRNKLEPGTKGTLKNSQEFWKKVESGEIILEEEY